MAVNNSDNNGKCDSCSQGGIEGIDAMGNIILDTGGTNPNNYPTCANCGRPITPNNPTISGSIGTYCSMDCKVDNEDVTDPSRKTNTGYSPTPFAAQNIESGLNK